VGPTVDGTPISARLLADVAGQTALRQKPVKPGQWVYEKFDGYVHFQGKSHRHTLRGWLQADGANYEVQTMIATGKVVFLSSKQMAAAAASEYAKLNSLTWDPAALESYLAHLRAPRNASPSQLAQNAFSQVEVLLSRVFLPPRRVAEVLHAVADIPGVTARKNVKIITGQSAAAFILKDGYGDTFMLLLNASTYQYLGIAGWTGRLSNPSYFFEEVLLEQAFVSGPGKRP
jgi:hypothetical protein